MTVDTVLPAPGVYILSIMAFNNPEQCIGTCESSDVAATQANASLIFGDGEVVDETGRVTFQARLEESDLSGVTFGPGLIDTYDAELHFTIQSKGPAIPEILDEQLDSGFAEFLVTDPMIVGDVSGNGVINATDASMVARHAAELPIDQIPPILDGVVIASGGRTNATERLVTTPATFVRSPLTIHDWTKAPASSTALGLNVPVLVPLAAIDTVLAGFENATTADDDEPPLALEDSVEQLLRTSLPLATD